jgi:hypothetical protein
VTGFGFSVVEPSGFATGVLADSPTIYSRYPSHEFIHVTLVAGGNLGGCSASRNRRTELQKATVPMHLLLLLHLHFTLSVIASR